MKDIPRRTEKNRLRRSSALSLKKVHTKLTDIDHVEIEDLTGKPTDKFSEIQLVEQWQIFGDQMKAAGELNTASVINVSKPVIRNGEIIFPLPTKLMEDQLGTIRPKLLHHLRTSLNNYSIQIKTVVVAAKKQTRAYLPKEKFQKMAEDNPDLILLKNKFNLDI